MTSIADQNTLALSDEAQQITDNVGQERCFLATKCAGEGVGPFGLCEACREDFVATFRDRNTYERIAFGFDEQDRVTPDRVADIVFGALPAALPIPEKARKLVVGGDPQAIKVAEDLLRMDDAALIETVGAHKANVEKIEAEAREMIDEYAAPSKAVVQVGYAVIMDRIRERRAKRLPSDAYNVTLIAGKDIDKRMDVLLELFDVLTPKQLEEALWVSGVDVSAVVKDPEKLKQLLAIEGVKPVYSAHAGKLRKLATDLGGKVREIVNRGCVDTFKQPTLVFEALESAQKNVTPLKAVG